MRSIPPVLLSKIKEQNQTIYNNANPKMSIQVSRAKDTVMDSTYWTVETIRTKEGLGDLSIAARRFKPYGGPNKLYNIYVDNGIVKTAIREYPDKLKDGWKDQFSLGAGSKVAMAFDGEWRRYRQLWRLVTHEKPWIFWVDGDNKLQAQLWDDVNTKQELASGVTYVRAIRAWKNLNIADKDQGIVVAYIKSDGKVYYRNYCQLLDLTYLWEPEREVIDFTGTALSLNLFITNDYRMGFMIEDSLSNIHWLITDRNWAGMAIAPEFIQASVSGSIDLIQITREYGYNTEYIEASVGVDISFLWGVADNDFRTAENFSITMLNEDEEEYQNWGFRIRVEVDHDMTALNHSDFTLQDGNNTPFAVTDITKAGYKEYVVTTADFNNAYGDLTLSFTTGNTKGEAGQAMDPFDITFTPINLVPTSVPLPEVEVIWNE